jgi:hypothetical protein
MSLALLFFFCCVRGDKDSKVGKSASRDIIIKKQTNKQTLRRRRRYRDAKDAKTQGQAESGMHRARFYQATKFQVPMYVMRFNMTYHCGAG